MSHEHESSYYEIALTNRQVLTVFVVLLTCLVAAFLSGVWIGQRDRVDGPLAALDEPPADNGTAELAELNFFAEAEPREPADAARPPDAAPGGAAADPAPAPPASEPEPRPTGPPREPARRPPSTAPGPVIQVFSTADQTQAGRVLQRLETGGYPAYLLEEDVAGQTMYRVRVGPYREESEARRIADELRRQYRLDTWITTQQPG